MNKKISQILLLMLIVSSTIFAQSKKDIKKNKVKSLTETIISYENGKEIIHNDLIRKFDKNGQVIEETNFDKNGKIKTKTISKFNNLEDKVEETVLDGNNRQISREVYKYDAEDEKSEEWHYNEKNEFESKSVYVVKNGLKIERKTYDSKGKLIQLKKYIYEK